MMIIIAKYLLTTKRGGAIIPNCGCNALRNGWKVLEMDTDKIKNGEVNENNKDTTGNI